jgi:hypothetical protein
MKALGKHKIGAWLLRPLLALVGAFGLLGSAATDAAVLHEREALDARVNTVREILNTRDRNGLPEDLSVSPDKPLIAQWYNWGNWNNWNNWANWGNWGNWFNR